MHTPLLLALMTAAGAVPFVSIWSTTAGENITLPILSASFDITVEWGDGSESNHTAPPVTHLYDTTGEHTITIEGEIKGFNLWNYTTCARINPVSEKLLSISSWGGFTVDSTSQGAFRGAFYLANITATDQPIFLPGAIADDFFGDCVRLNSPLTWNISMVTSARGMFLGCRKLDQPLTFYSSPLLRSTVHMFGECNVLTHPVYISDTSGVVSMGNMFQRAYKFNHPVVLNTTNVTNFYRMFYQAFEFNQTLSFDVSNTDVFTQMFLEASKFNSPLNFTNTTKPVSVSGMFSHASSFNQPINWLKAVTYTNSMFENAYSFNQPISFELTDGSYDTSKMFKGARSFNHPVSFDSDGGYLLDEMFAGAESFNQAINFVTDGVISMSSMFAGCTSLEQPVNFTSTAQVQTMAFMFANATKFNHPLNLDTRSVINATGMFEGASSFTQDLTAWATSTITNCTNFCASCRLPEFTKCVPCRDVRVTLSGWKACSCPAPQILLNESHCGSLAPTKSPTNSPTASLAPTKSPTNSPTVPSQAPSPAALSAAPGHAKPLVCLFLLALVVLQ